MFEEAIRYRKENPKYRLFERYWDFLTDLITLFGWVYFIVHSGQSTQYNIWVPIHFVCYCWLFYPSVKTNYDWTRINDVGISETYITFHMMLLYIYYMAYLIGIFVFWKNGSNIEKHLAYFFLALLIDLVFTILVCWIHHFFVESCYSEKPTLLQTNAQNIIKSFIDDSRNILHQIESMEAGEISSYELTKVEPSLKETQPQPQQQLQTQYSITLCV